MNVVVTGASKGIGKAVAAAFAAEGNQVFICARNEVQLYNTVAELQNSLSQCKYQGQSCRSFQKRRGGRPCTMDIETGSSVDILVNNAGTFLPGSVFNEEDGLLETMIQTNLYSAYHLTRALLPAMMEKKSGHIFNMCSIASLNAYKNGGSYSISKFALAGFSKNLREEMKPWNIKVTAVYPGAVLTDSWEGFDNSRHRIMESKDIADMILAMSKLSPAAVIEDIVLRPQLGDL
jgi:short-subunit dehydrogenase